MIAASSSLRYPLNSFYLSTLTGEIEALMVLIRDLKKQLMMMSCSMLNYGKRARRTSVDQLEKMKGLRVLGSTPLLVARGLRILELVKMEHTKEPTLKTD